MSSENRHGGGFREYRQRNGWRSLVLGFSTLNRRQKTLCGFTVFAFIVFIGIPNFLRAYNTLVSDPLEAKVSVEDTLSITTSDTLEVRSTISKISPKPTSGFLRVLPGSFNSSMFGLTTKSFPVIFSDRESFYVSENAPVEPALTEDPKYNIFGYELAPTEDSAGVLVGVRDFIALGALRVRKDSRERFVSFPAFTDTTYLLKSYTLDVALPIQAERVSWNVRITHDGDLIADINDRSLNSEFLACQSLPSRLLCQTPKDAPPAPTGLSIELGLRFVDESREAVRPGLYVE